ncbi:MAG: hypothetical protein GF308_17435 [Candidatus Heimdallarchaeota archaeon]|nr:hypothetical protein [Candidatus Heimdallarchaeota archaeon]
MTVRGRHLQCDVREQCISCTQNTWPPTLSHPKKYYFCESCQKDVLCKHGVSISFNYHEDGTREEIVRCMQCSSILIEKIWPNIPERLVNELLKIGEKT